MRQCQRLRERGRDREAECETWLIKKPDRIMFEPETETETERKGQKDRYTERQTARCGF